jgi:hypothetical protein
MIMPHKLDVNWMKSRCKLCLDAIVISTWCDVMSFAIKILSNLFKVTKGIVVTHGIYNWKIVEKINL